MTYVRNDYEPPRFSLSDPAFLQDSSLRRKRRSFYAIAFVACLGVIGALAALVPLPDAIGHYLTDAVVIGLAILALVVTIFSLFAYIVLQNAVKQFYEARAPKHGAANFAKVAANALHAPASLAQRLEELESARRGGLIDEREYQQKRAAIIAQH